MLYDRIQQLSHKLHTELRPFQDATQKESDSFSSRHDEDCTDDASNLISVHSSKQSADVREDISSRNFTLVDKESLSTSDEDGLREDSDDKDSTSHALVVYSGSEVNKSHVSNTEEQGQLREDLEHIEAALGGDGDADGNPQQRSSGKIGGGDERTLPTSDINPKLYKALEKMRKLDERLANITKVKNKEGMCVCFWRMLVMIVDIMPPATRCIYTCMYFFPFLVTAERARGEETEEAVGAAAGGYGLSLRV